MEISCIRGFRSTEEIIENFVTDIEKCDHCPYTSYKNGLMTCLLTEIEEGNRK